MNKLLTIFDDSKKAFFLIGAALLILVVVVAFSAEGKDNPQYILAQPQMPITRSIDSWENSQYWYDPAALEPASGDVIVSSAIKVKPLN